MKMKKIFFSLILVIFYFSVNSCKQEISQESQLQKNIEELSAYFTNRNWAKIYRLREKAEENNIGGSMGSLRDFKNRCNEFYLYVDFNVKVDSVLIEGNLATVKKILSGRGMMKPHIAIRRFTYDFWVYKNGTWNLKDWEHYNDADSPALLDTLNIPLLSESRYKFLVDSLWTFVKKEW